MNAALVNTGPKPSAASAGTSASNGVEASEVSRWLGAGRAVLVDVREPDEHARERIEGAKLVPLGKLTAGAVSDFGAARLVVHCKSGRRSEEAVNRLAAWGVEAVSMRGGIEAWKSAGLPVVRGPGAPIPIMRQVQIVVGALLVVGTALAWWVSAWFLLVPALLGVGLMFAGISGFCGLAAVVGAMPWNRAAAAGAKACAVKA